MHLSGAIETFLVFLPRRANHRGIVRFAAACNSLHTCRLSIPYTWFVNSARERERERCTSKRDRKNWEGEKRRNHNTDNYRSYDPEYRNTQRCMANPYSLGRYPSDSTKNILRTEFNTPQN